MSSRSPFFEVFEHVDVLGQRGVAATAIVYHGKCRPMNSTSHTSVSQDLELTHIHFLMTQADPRGARQAVQGSGRPT